MPFSAEDLSAFFDSDLSPGSGESTAIFGFSSFSVIFDRGFNAMAGGEAYSLTCHCKTSDVESLGIKENDEIVINDILYRVIGVPQHDGNGFATLNLREGL